LVCPVVVCLVVACLGMVSGCAERPQVGVGEPEPDLEFAAAVDPAAPFTLTDQDGQEFSSESLAGKVWLGAVFFSNCPGPCFRENQAIADILREIDEGTVYDVLERFPEEERPRYNTVITVLRTLGQKGLVEHRKQDRAFVFRRTPEAQRVREGVLREVLDRVFGGSPTRLMATLLREESVTPELVEELRALLEREGSDDEQ